MAFLIGSCAIPGCGKKVEIAPEDEGCEEKCCPGFWADEGVPPIPPFSWIFDPKNKILNDNKYCAAFGAMGFKVCDARRKEYMGTALGVTVIAIAVTVFGCFALSSDAETIRWTAWGTAWYRNETTMTATKFYIGLVDFVVTECKDTSGSEGWKFECDTVQNTAWADLDSDSDLYGFPWSSVKECKDQAEGNQFGAFSTAATLIFALNGCLTRIRKVADTNFQKILGCLPDTFGVISLFLSLYNFGVGCYGEMPNKVDGKEVTYFVGSGYMGYAGCLVAAFIRVIMHYLTPVPGKGSDCPCCAVVESADVAPEAGKVEEVEMPSVDSLGLDEEKLQQLTAAFKEFDTDGSGRIDKDELKAVMLKSGHEISTEEAEKIIAQYDKSGDGEISFYEFALMMKDRPPAEDGNLFSAATNIFGGGGLF